MASLILELWFFKIRTISGSKCSANRRLQKEEFHNDEQSGIFLCLTGFLHPQYARPSFHPLVPRRQSALSSRGSRGGALGRVSKDDDWAHTGTSSQSLTVAPIIW